MVVWVFSVCIPSARQLGEIACSSQMSKERSNFNLISEVSHEIIGLTYVRADCM